MKKICCFILTILGIMIFSVIVLLMIKHIPKKFDTEKIGKEEVLVKNVTDFKWDTMYIFAPYSDDKSIESLIGVHVKSNSLQDDQCIAVFLKDGKLVHEQMIRMQYTFVDPYIQYDSKASVKNDIDSGSFIFTQ